MWDLLVNVLYWGFVAYCLVWACYGTGQWLWKRYVNYMKNYIAAENFAKDGKVAEQELPYCTCGDRHKEPMCY